MEKQVDTGETERGDTEIPTVSLLYRYRCYIGGSVESVLLFYGWSCSTGSADHSL